MTGVEPATPGRRDRRALARGLLAVAVVAWWAVEEGGAAPTVWYPGALILLAALLTVARPHRLRRLPVAARWALAALAAYAAWSFLSIAWADARGDAWDGANRTLLYLTVLGLFCSEAWRPADVAALLGAYVAAVWVIGTWTLIAAIADSDSTAFVDGRLAGPVGYENASAALLFGAFWIAVLLATRRELRAPARGLLLAAAGVLLELGILAQSRGSLIAMAAALGLALWLAPERGRTAMALAAVAAPATLSLPVLLSVYSGDAEHALARAGVAIALSAAALLAAGLASGRLDRPRRMRASLPMLAAAVAVASAVMAAGLPARFTAGAESGRSDFWRVAAGQLARQPLLGAGADNFAHDYAQRRHRREEPMYPHSLEWRALGQTGLVGGTLLIGFLSAAFVAARPDRRDALRGPLALAAVVPAGYWLAHASLEWLWELPGVTAPAIACLGLAAGLRATPAAPQGRVRSRLHGGLVALVAVAAGLSYALPALAAREVERAAGLWDRDRPAARAALERARALNPLSARPDAIAGALAIQAGDRRAAHRAFVRAIGRDAHDWHSQTALAVLDLQAGRRTAALARLRRARALNPLEPAIAAAQHGTPLPPGVSERIARLAVPGPLGRRPVSCRPVLGLAAACSREEGE